MTEVTPTEKQVRVTRHFPRYFQEGSRKPADIEVLNTPFQPPHFRIAAEETLGV